MLLAAVAAWALLAKVIPPLYDYGPPGATRLRAPVGLWNQLALLGDIALPLALWRRRLSGTLLAYLWLVALVLTYSRGGLATAAVVVTAYLVLADDRLDRGAALVAAAVPAAIVAGVAFALPGITNDAQSTSTRWHDGLVFGAVLLGGAVVAAAAVACASTARHAGAPPCARRARSHCPRGSGRGRGAEGRLVRKHDVRRELERPVRLGIVELPDGLVASGLGWVAGTEARGDRRRDLPSRQPQASATRTST